MQNGHNYASSALNKLITTSAITVSAQDLKLLEKMPDEIKPYSERVGEIYEIIFRGFFHCAARGVLLYPEEKVAERFGNSIEDNYPEANGVFLRFAKTYWTLQTLKHDLRDQDRMKSVGAWLLVKLEQDIGPVFFPFPGPKKIAASKREKTQRELLKEFGKDIDIEEFMKGNSILIRDRKSSIWGKLKIYFNLITTCQGNRRRTR